MEPPSSMHGHAAMQPSWLPGWRQQARGRCGQQVLLFASITGQEGSRGLPRGRSLLTPKSQAGADSLVGRGTRHLSSSEEEVEVMRSIMEGAGEDVRKEVMGETLREVIARRDAREAAHGRRHGRNAKGQADGKEEEEYQSSEEAEEDTMQGQLRAGASAQAQRAAAKREADKQAVSSTERRWGWVSALSMQPPIPAPSSSARKALGDEWYQDRCVVCAGCGGAVRAVLRSQRGVRCAGCCRWFHDACAPAGMLPESRRAVEADPLTTSLYHCGQCKQVRSALAATAAQLHAAAASSSSHASGAAGGAPSSTTCGALFPVPGTTTPKPTASSGQPFWGVFSSWFGGSSGVPPSLLQDGHSLVLVDMGALRASLAAGQTDKQQAAAPKPEARPDSGELFKRIPRYQMRAPPAALATVHSTKGRSSRAGEGSLPGPRGELADVRAAAAVLRTYDPDEDTEDVLEDGWAAVLRHNGAPVAAATLNVFGDDHARLQAVATTPSASRQGHASALVRELERVLSGAGVSRLVAVVPGSEAARHPGATPLLTRKLGLTPLQDLALLAGWKEAFRSYYATELLGRGVQVLTKPLPKQPRQQQAQQEQEPVVSEATVQKGKVRK